VRSSAEGTRGTCFERQDQGSSVKTEVPTLSAPAPVVPLDPSSERLKTLAASPEALRAALEQAPARGATTSRSPPGAESQPKPQLAVCAPGPVPPPRPGRGTANSTPRPTQAARAQVLPCPALALPRSALPRPAPPRPQRQQEPLTAGRLDSESGTVKLDQTPTSNAICFT